MPSKRTAPEQQLSELIAALTKERDMWKASYGKTCELFHAKCAEIAALTKERDEWRDHSMLLGAYRGELAIAKAEIAALTEQRDRTMRALREPSDMLIDKVAVAFCAASGNLCNYPGCGDICRGETREGAIGALRIAALDAETAPSLPETPEA